MTYNAMEYRKMMLDKIMVTNYSFHFENQSEITRVLLRIETILKYHEKFLSIYELRHICNQEEYYIDCDYGTIEKHKYTGWFESDYDDMRFFCDFDNIQIIMPPPRINFEVLAKIVDKNNSKE